MEIRPILSTLMRSKVALILIGLQIALTLAIVCNSLFIINQRFETMGRPSGMDESNTFIVSSSGFANGFNVHAVVVSDLAMLRGLPGVRAVAPINTVPLSNSGWGEGVNLKTDQKKSTASAGIYFADDNGLEAYGLDIVAGRNFKPEEIGIREPRSSTWPASALMTKALADKVFSGESALGKQFYLNVTAPPLTVIGIIDRLQIPWPHAGSRSGDKNVVEYSVLIPQFISDGNQSRYLIRSAPGQRDALMKTVETRLEESDRGRIVEGIQSMQKIRDDAYHEDRAMTLILGGVIFALLAITALGIVGMASFWVGQRTKQIGTRRALGATRFDILRYFLTENFLITTLGLGVGIVLTYAFNLWLMSHYHSPLLPWFYVPIGVVCLWLLGQIAVFGPATWASRVPPAVATRSV